MFWLGLLIGLVLGPVMSVLVLWLLRDMVPSLFTPTDWHS
jgi:hypothetical protein